MSCFHERYMAVALGLIKTCVACGLKFYVSREHISREFGFHSSFLGTNFRGLHVRYLKVIKRRRYCNFFVYSTFLICQLAYYRKVTGLPDSSCTQKSVCPESLPLFRIFFRDFPLRYDSSWESWFNEQINSEIADSMALYRNLTQP